MDSLKSLLPISTRDVESTADDTSNNGGGGGGAEEDSTESYFSGWMDTEEPDPWIPALTRKQRLMGFFAFACLSVLCFSLSMMLVPFIVLKARKFALLFSTGSLSALLSFAMLRGPSKFMAYMFAKDKLFFSLAYVGSLILTLYCAMGLRRTIPTIICASVQFMVLGNYLLGYIPGGMMGVRMLFKAWLKTMTTVVIPFLKRCLPQLFKCCF